MFDLRFKAIQLLNTVRNPHLVAKYGFDLPGLVACITSTVCNRRCPYCLHGKKKLTPQDISPEILAKFLCRVEEARWRGIALLGGFAEQCLLKPCESTLRELTRMGCLNSLYSNGDYPDLLGKWLDEGILKRVIITAHQNPNAQWHKRVKVVKDRHPFRVKVYAPTIHDWAGQVETEGAVPILMETCHSESGSYVVDMDGSLKLCCVDAESQYNFGSVYDAPMMEAWTAPEWKAKRHKLRHGIAVCDLCRSCGLRREWVSLSK